MPRTVKSTIEFHLLTDKNELEVCARSLADHMKVLADRLHTTRLDDLDSTDINSLGEVQGLGDRIDRLCATLSRGLDLRAVLAAENTPRSS